MDVAVVTGAGRGLGRALATRLAERGLSVLVTDIDLDSAERAAAEIGERARAAALDVRDRAACRQVAEQAERLGRLAVWVNNAGVLRTGRAWDQSDDEIDLMMGANLAGVINGSRAAVARMRANGGGRILNIASLSSLGPSPGLAVYGATKHGVLAFSLSLQAELVDADVPIDIRSVCPHAIETDMVRERADDPEAAIIWSGTDLLGAEEVADRAMSALYGKRLVTVIPAHMGVLMRAVDAAPRLGVRTLPLFRWLGERNRRRWVGAGG